MKELTLARAHASIGAARYAVTITSGHHSLQADESPALGGQGVGPAPYDLLLSSLGACTSITLKMYAERKQWDLQALRVDLRYSRDGDKARIDRALTIEGNLDDAQRARLADVAERTPVTLTLKSGVEILTELRQ
jgi:putative redox protein